MLRNTLVLLSTCWINERFHESKMQMQSVLAMMAIIAIGLGPMAIDGFTQLLSPYESTNLMRILTGFPAGFVGGWIFSAMFSARPHEFENSESVLLPADAKLRMV